jgi:hypothetical protein
LDYGTGFFPENEIIRISTNPQRLRYKKSIDLRIGHTP